MAKARYVNNYNPLFPSAGNKAVYGKKVYAYKSDGKISTVVKKAAYVPQVAYKAYTQKRRGPNYGKFDFELN